MSFYYNDDRYSKRAYHRTVNRFSATMVIMLTVVYLSIVCPDDRPFINYVLSSIAWFLIAFAALLVIGVVAGMLKDFWNWVFNP